MGGSTKKVEETVKRSDLGRAGAHVQDKGSEVIEGAKEHGSGMAAGLSKGLQTAGDMVVGGLQHNFGELAKIIHGPGSGDSAEAQSASATYSGASKRSTSGAKKKGDLEAGERKGATGKQKLYARRKTA